MTYDDMMDAMTKVTAALKKSEEEVIKLKEENSKLNGYVHAQSARLEHFEQERTMMQGLLNHLSSDITSEAKQKAEASVSSSSWALLQSMSMQTVSITTENALWIIFWKVCIVSKYWASTTEHVTL